MAAPLLNVDKLTLRFGGLTAVSEVDLRVEEGEIAAVIGYLCSAHAATMTGVCINVSGGLVLD